MWILCIRELHMWKKRKEVLTYWVSRVTSFGSDVSVHAFFPPPWPIMWTKLDDKERTIENSETSQWSHTDHISPRHRLLFCREKARQRWLGGKRWWETCFLFLLLKYLSLLTECYLTRWIQTWNVMQRTRSRSYRPFNWMRKVEIIWFLVFDLHLYSVLLFRIFCFGCYCLVKSITSVALAPLSLLFPLFIHLWLLQQWCFACVSSLSQYLSESK